MRILTRKIHRAYPELDKFDDKVCTRYIKRAKRLQNAWKGWVFILLSVPVGLVLWSVFSFMTAIFMSGLESQYYLALFDPPNMILIVTFYTGFIWFPLLTCLFTRDRWLHRCVRKQLTGVQCPTCGYSLIGLSLLKDTPAPTVHCPECGHHTALKTLGLTPADIDPTLINSS